VASQPPWASPHGYEDFHERVPASLSFASSPSHASVAETTRPPPPKTSSFRPGDQRTPPLPRFESTRHGGYEEQPENASRPPGEIATIAMQEVFEVSRAVGELALEASAMAAIGVASSLRKWVEEARERVRQRSADERSDGGQSELESVSDSTWESEDETVVAEGDAEVHSVHEYGSRTWVHGPPAPPSAQMGVCMGAHMWPSSVTYDHAGLAPAASTRGYVAPHAILYPAACSSPPTHLRTVGALHRGAAV